MTYSAIMGAETRLKEARIAAGYSSAADAARAIGVAVPTYVAHENGSRGFPAKRAEIYARRFKVNLEWLLTGRKGPAQSSRIEEVSSLLPIIGLVQAGAWKEQAMLEPADAEQVPIPSDQRIPGARQYYLRIIGDSVDEVIPDGALALCCDVWDWARDEADLFRRGKGKLVVAQRERHGLFETTIKRLAVIAGVAQLHTASKSPQFKNEAPIELTDTGDVNGVAIVAVVTGAQIPL